jgi:hypothetical protein
LLNFYDFAFVANLRGISGLWDIFRTNLICFNLSNFSSIYFFFFDLKRKGTKIFFNAKIREIVGRFININGNGSSWEFNAVANYIEEKFVK